LSVFHGRVYQSCCSAPTAWHPGWPSCLHLKPAMFKVLITKFTEKRYFLRSCQSECAVYVITVLFNGLFIVFTAYCNKITIGTLRVCNLKGHIVIEELL
jgi:hypothetical protein